MEISIQTSARSQKCWLMYLDSILSCKGAQQSETFLGCALVEKLNTWMHAYTYQSVVLEQDQVQLSLHVLYWGRKTLVILCTGLGLVSQTGSQGRMDCPAIKQSIQFYAQNIRAWKLFPPVSTRDEDDGLIVSQTITLRFYKKLQ